MTLCKGRGEWDRNRLELKCNTPLIPPIVGYLDTVEEGRADKKCWIRQGGVQKCCLRDGQRSTLSNCPWRTIPSLGSMSSDPSLFLISLRFFAPLSLYNNKMVGGWVFRCGRKERKHSRRDETTPYQIFFYSTRFCIRIDERYISFQKQILSILIVRLICWQILYIDSWRIN